MDEFKVLHLPITKGRELLGLISENELLEVDDTQKKLQTLTQKMVKPFILDKQHLYEVIKMFANHDVSVLPVLTQELKYLGAITLGSVMKRMSWLSAAREPGGIVVLEMNKMDYALSEIAQIIESNDGKVLSCHVSSSVDNRKILVTIKLNTEDLSRILQTFERYNYSVVSTYNQADYKEDIKNKYDAFMNYINM